DVRRRQVRPAPVRAGRRHERGRRRPHAVRAVGRRFGFTSREWRALRALASPAGIQKALEAMPYHVATTAWSPRRVLREGTAHCLEGAAFGPAAPAEWPARRGLREAAAHCLEGAVFAAAALRPLGFPPLLLDLEAVQDSDHVIAVVRVDGPDRKST